MSYNNRSQASRRGTGRLLITMLAMCLPVIAAAFFSSSFFKLGSAPVAHAAGHHSAANVAVSISDSSFNPSSVTINPGDSVTWTNNGTSRHRVRDTAHNLFDSDDLNPGQSFTFTFTNSGTVPYRDERNGFTGVVNVTGTPGPTGTAGATGTAQTTGTPGATGTAGTPGPTNTPGSGQIRQINIFNDDGFDPANITINSGDTVRWTNYDGDTHTSTSPGNWNSGDLRTGQSFQVTLINNGTYSYFCAYHSQMQGTITVVGGPTATPQVTNTPGAGTFDVNIQNFAFTPQNLNIVVGSTVRWTNRDSAAHTSTSPGNWDSGNLGTNQTFQRTFTTVGSFTYFCGYHSGMTGTINVVQPGQNTPTPAATSTPLPTNTPAATSTPGGATIVDVSIQVYAFQPQNITVQAGTIVRWTNLDNDTHTVTSPGNFNSGNLTQGQTWQYTFNTPGTFNYFCAVHPSMTGSVTVTGGGSGTPTAQVTNTVQTTATAQGTATTQATQPPTSTAQATTPPTSTPLPQTHNVSIQNLAFTPIEITIRQGDTVRWTNNDPYAHTATSAGNFDSGALNQGQTFQFTFNTPGVYEYICSIHPPQFMPPGRIIVQAPAPNPTATATRVAGQTFNDVMPSEYFYTPVNWLVAHNIVSGYSDGTFRPYNNTTRAQVTKMVVLGEGWQQINPASPTFIDVDPGTTFYQYIETAVQHGIITGYADRTFRPNADVTRGQITKIVVSARGWMLNNPTTPTFSDVARGSTFYEYIETASQHAILGGYSDGTFRPGANATRGQVSKILYNALTSSR